MAKAKSIYSCTECGAVSPKWQGQCPGCALWNTLVETVAEASAATSRYAGSGAASRPQQLSEIRPREEPRLPSGLRRKPGQAAVDQRDYRLAATGCREACAGHAVRARDANV